MGALHRFFVPEEFWNDTCLWLRGEEAHHCRNVLRHSAGDRVEVFQGLGRSAVARIRSLRKSEVELEIERVMQRHPFPLTVTLAQAIPKGKQMEWIVQKAAEIGVARIVPLVTERTVVRLGEEDNKREKWRRVALEACKQCGQDWLPEVMETQSIQDFFSKDASAWRLVAALTPDAKRWKELLPLRPAEVKSVSVAIGPEGDFSPVELECFRVAKAQFLCLGPTVLRSETAAIYALSLISQEFF